jgi:hypothetical protein
VGLFFLANDGTNGTELGRATVAAGTALVRTSIPESIE